MTETMTETEKPMELITVSVEQAIESSLSRMRKTEVSLNLIEEEYGSITVTGPDDTEGIESAKVAYGVVSRMLTAFEKCRKAEKQDVNKVAKAIDGYAREIKERLEPLKKSLENLSRTAEIEKARLEVEAQREAERVLQVRVNRLASSGCPAVLSELQGMSENEFEIHFVKEVARCKKAKEDNEAELAQMEALKAENRKLKEEQDRQNEERRKVEAEDQRRLREIQEAEHKAELEARRLAIAPVLDQVRAFSSELAEFARSKGKPEWVEVIDRHLVAMNESLQDLVKKRGDV